MRDSIRIGIVFASGYFTGTVSSDLSFWPRLAIAVGVGAATGALAAFLRQRGA